MTNATFADRKNEMFDDTGRIDGDEKSILCFNKCFNRKYVDIYLRTHGLFQITQKCKQYILQ